jgi:hypothetical protein
MYNTCQVNNRVYIWNGFMGLGVIRWFLGLDKIL